MINLGDITYVPAQPDDCAFFIHVHHTAYRDIIESMFGWDESFQRNNAKRVFEEGGISIIHYKGQKVGVFGLERRSDCLWLKELFILPEFQGQKIGSRIVDHYIALAQEHSVPLRLRTLKENRRAQQFYVSKGMTVLEETDIHWYLSTKTN